MVSFIIPMHNEQDNCERAIVRIIEFAKGKKLHFEIIPVDDKSTDDTKEILEKLRQRFPKIVSPTLRKPHSNEKPGNTMGKALVEGTRKAKGDIIIWTMGDLSDNPITYMQIINKINDGFDLVFGSRYMQGGSRGNLDPVKAFLSSYGTVLAQLMFQLPVHDITNAFRGFRKQVFNSVELKSAGFSISPEFAIKAYLKGFRLGEVPTEYKNRINGVSSFKLVAMARSYLTLFMKLYWQYKIHPKLTASWA